MIDRLPRRLRLHFSGDAGAEVASSQSDNEVDFVAYGEDCLLSGRARLDADRLTDMLNDHDEYALTDVTVHGLDGSEPVVVSEIVVPRDEIFLVHASGPRGDAGRRSHTTLQLLALKAGPYGIRGYFHAFPGADPVVALRRRKAMVPLTDARIEYLFHGRKLETRVDTLIVNREQMDWVQAVLPGELEFPDHPRRMVGTPA